VVLSAAGRQVQTKVIDNSLDPVWNEMLQLNVDNTSTQIELRVFDKDVLSEDDLMGLAEISLEGCPAMTPVLRTLELREVPNGGGGTIDVEITWSPLGG
jgi:Ca2+-dependent lipid-binding protein